MHGSRTSQDAADCEMGVLDRFYAHDPEPFRFKMSPLPSLEETASRTDRAGAQRLILILLTSDPVRLTPCPIAYNLGNPLPRQNYDVHSRTHYGKRPSCCWRRPVWPMYELARCAPSTTSYRSHRQRLRFFVAPAREPSCVPSSQRRDARNPCGKVFGDLPGIRHSTPRSVPSQYPGCVELGIKLPRTSAGRLEHYLRYISDITLFDLFGVHLRGAAYRMYDSPGDGSLHARDHQQLRRARMTSPGCASSCTWLPLISTRQSAPCSDRTAIRLCPSRWRSQPRRRCRCSTACAHRRSRLRRRQRARNASVDLATRARRDAGHRDQSAGAFRHSDHRSVRSSVLTGATSAIRLTGWLHRWDALIAWRLNLSRQTTAQDAS